MVPFLKFLQPLLKGCAYFDSHVFTLFLPVYLLVIFALGYLRYREGKRVDPKDDWLIGGYLISATCSCSSDSVMVLSSMGRNRSLLNDRS